MKKTGSLHLHCKCCNLGLKIANSSSAFHYISHNDLVRKETDRGAKKTEYKHLNTNQLKKKEILAARRCDP